MQVNSVLIRIIRHILVTAYQVQCVFIQQKSKDVRVVKSSGKSRSHRDTKDHRYDSQREKVLFCLYRVSRKNCSTFDKGTGFRLDF